MKDGFIKVAAGTPLVRVADCNYNAVSAVKVARQAEKAGAALLVLPELCLTGYTCGDLFLQQTLIDGAAEALRTYCRETRPLTLLSVVGLPLRFEGKLYNCAAVVHGGELLGVVPKTHLPNYGVFSEPRHFTPADPMRAGELIGFGRHSVLFGTQQLFCCDEQPDFVLGVEICEDLWTPCPPSVFHAAAGATVIANLSASDETIGKDDYRRALVTGQSARSVCGYVYADAGEGESTTDLVFAAHNLIAENGHLLTESERFCNGLAVSEVDVCRLTGERRRLNTYPAGCEGYRRVRFSMPPRKTQLTRPVSAFPFIPEDGIAQTEALEEILQIQAHGLKKRLAHSGAKTAVIGISGGLDSALALLVSVRAIDLLERPRTDLVAVTMPCFGTTERTRGNADLLCARLGVDYRQVDIKKAVELHFQDIGHDPRQMDTTYENAQARERTQVLMDIANCTGGLVIGTGDLSELALGWATYNGDHMSMYGVNASVPKTLVRHLVNYEARHTADLSLREALLDILNTPVSPELLPPAEGEICQMTEDLVGPYELHDFFLYYLLRWGFPPRKIFRLAKIAFVESYPDETLLHWLKIFFRRFFSQQFKRSCMPDGPKIGSVSLSPRGDWRMPSDASAALWLEELEQLG